MTSKKNVLIAPLDWGLGHATRCIPVITEFLTLGANVIISGSGNSLLLLKKEFPQLTAIELPGYNVSYSQDANMLWAMLKQAPKIFMAIAKEKNAVKKIVERHNIDIIISDNRYGLRHQKTKNIFITHQLNIQVPDSMAFLHSFVNRINAGYINRFHECWIPDANDGFKLSGVLSCSKNISVPVNFIGPLSRFNKSVAKKQDYLYPIMVILSGPEPQRTIVEGKIIDQLFKLNAAALVIRGRPADTQELKSRGMIDFRNHATTAEILSSISADTVFISRSGYSTLMDLSVLGNKAILIPTPGQTEQEYLGEFVKDKKIFFSQKQSEINLADALGEVNDFSGILMDMGNTTLAACIKSLLQQP